MPTSDDENEKFGRVLRWQGRVEEYVHPLDRNSPPQRICLGRNKYTGKRCRKWALTGRDYCKYHGGHDRRGFAHYKIIKKLRNGEPLGDYMGRYSEHIKGIDLLTSYEEAKTDPQLLELNDEIALVRAHITELLPKLQTGEASTLWKDTKKAWRAYSSAIAREDAISASEAKADLDDLLRRGDQNYRVWNDILVLFERLQKLVAQEQKRRMDMHALVSADQAVGLMSRVVNVIIAELKDDPVKLQSIYEQVMVAIQHEPMMAALNIRK